MKQSVLIIMKKIKEDNIGAYAAQAALFLIMSIIPFLLVLISLIRYTPVSESLILTGIELISPGYVSTTVITIVDEVYHNTGGVLFVSLIFAVYSAAKTIQSLRYGLNIVYEIEETRNWFVLRLRAMIETLGLILAVLLLMVMLMFGQAIQELLAAYAPFVAVVTAVILKLRLLILFFVMTVIFAVIYKEIPNRKASFRSQLIGAFGCSVAWYVFTFGVSIYINYFNGFSFYGSMTSIVLLMFWLYFAMYIFLVCGAINSSIEVILKELKNNFKKKRDENRESRGR
ncbi:MAG: YihY/virulence factor BrkB family protein [Clostridiales bacterium]|nr:YihY/virulence factor BrkB family protein [Clostridiales bacterium]MCD8109345.1 YihY/virulence factor BrkB family protein [Clostridiales bacterium]